MHAVHLYQVLVSLADLSSSGSVLNIILEVTIWVLGSHQLPQNWNAENYGHHFRQIDGM